MTSIRLEAQMWQCLQEVAHREGKSIQELLTEINQRRRESTLTAAIRVYVVRYFQEAATEEGHRQAGHGAPVLC